jgi:hypothetical protein
MSPRAWRRSDLPPPHVFGEVDVTGADEVLVNWER